MSNANLEMLETVAEGLADLLAECVFVGGATTFLYLDREVATEPRPTLDVDCIIEIQSRVKYAQLEEKLRERGFKNDRRPNAPICRWLYKNVTVDMMPTAEEILGFSNRWYLAGMQRRVLSKLPSGTSIYLFTLPYFIASKLEAYLGRGRNDPRTSHDIEDVLYVVGGSGNAAEQILSSDPELQEYLSETFAKLLGSRDFVDAISIHLESEPTGSIERVTAILSSAVKSRRGQV